MDKSVPFIVYGLFLSSSYSAQTPHGLLTNPSTSMKPSRKTCGKTRKTARIALLVVITMAKQHVRTVTKRRVRKAGDGYRKCNMCHGTGRIKTGKK